MDADRFKNSSGTGTLIYQPDSLHVAASRAEEAATRLRANLKTLYSPSPLNHSVSQSRTQSPLAPVVGSNVVVTGHGNVIDATNPTIQNLDDTFECHSVLPKNADLIPGSPIVGQTDAASLAFSDHEAVKGDIPFDHSVASDGNQSMLLLEESSRLNNKNMFVSRSPSTSMLRKPVETTSHKAADPQQKVGILASRTSQPPAKLVSPRKKGHAKAAVSENDLWKSWPVKQSKKSSWRTWKIVDGRMTVELSPSSTSRTSNIAPESSSMTIPKLLKSQGTSTSKEKRSFNPVENVQTASADSVQATRTAPEINRCESVEASYGRHLAEPSSPELSDKLTCKSARKDAKRESYDSELPVTLKPPRGSISKAFCPANDIPSERRSSFRQDVPRVERANDGRRSIASKEAYSIMRDIRKQHCADLSQNDLREVLATCAAKVFTPGFCRLLNEEKCRLSPEMKSRITQITKGVLHKKLRESRPGSSTCMRKGNVTSRATEEPPRLAPYDSVDLSSLAAGETVEDLWRRTSNCERSKQTGGLGFAQEMRELEITSEQSKRRDVSFETERRENVMRGKPKNTRDREETCEDESLPMNCEHIEMSFAESSRCATYDAGIGLKNNCSQTLKGFDECSAIQAPNAEEASIPKFVEPALVPLSNSGSVLTKKLALPHISNPPSHEKSPTNNILGVSAHKHAGIHISTPPTCSSLLSPLLETQPQIPADPQVFLLSGQMMSQSTDSQPVQIPATKKRNRIRKRAHRHEKLRELARLEEEKREITARLDLKYGAMHYDEESASLLSLPSLASLLRWRELGHDVAGSGDAIVSISAGIKQHLTNWTTHWRTWNGFSKDVMKVNWSPNGSIFVAGTSTELDDQNIQYNKPNNLLIGDIEHNTIHELPDHHIDRPKPEYIDYGENALEDTYNTVDPIIYTTISAVAFSPTGHRMYSASYDKTIKIWDVSKAGHYHCLETLRHEEHATLLAVNPAIPGIFATAQKTVDDSICVFGTQSSCLDGEDDEYEYGGRGNTKHIQYLASRRAQSNREWEMFPASLEWGQCERTNHLLLGGFSSDKARDSPFNRPGDLCLWDMIVGRRLKLGPSAQEVFDISWHPSLALFAAATGPGSLTSLTDRRRTRSLVRTWAPLQGPHLVMEYECPAVDINDVRWCPSESNYISAGCTDGVTYVWDYRMGDRILHTLEHDAPIEQMALGRPIEEQDTGVQLNIWADEGPQLYTGSSDGVVKYWDILRAPEDVLIRDVATFDSGIMCGAMSPRDGTLLIGLIRGAVELLSPCPSTQPKVPYSGTYYRESYEKMKYVSAKEPEKEATLDGIVSEQLDSEKLCIHPIFGAGKGPAYDGPYAAWARPDGVDPTYTPLKPDILAGQLCPTERKAGRRLGGRPDVRATRTFRNAQKVAYERNFLMSRQKRPKILKRGAASIAESDLEESIKSSRRAMGKRKKVMLDDGSEEPKAFVACQEAQYSGQAAKNSRKDAASIGPQIGEWGPGILPRSAYPNMTVFEENLNNEKKTKYPNQSRTYIDLTEDYPPEHLDGRVKSRGNHARQQVDVDLTVDDSSKTGIPSLATEAHIKSEHKAGSMSRPARSLGTQRSLREIHASHTSDHLGPEPGYSSPVQQSTMASNDKEAIRRGSSGGEAPTLLAESRPSSPIQEDNLMTGLDGKHVTTASDSNGVERPLENCDTANLIKEVSDGEKSMASTNVELFSMPTPRHESSSVNKQISTAVPIPATTWAIAIDDEAAVVLTADGKAVLTGFGPEEDFDYNDIADKADVQALLEEARVRHVDDDPCECEHQNPQDIHEALQAKWGDFRI